MREKLIFSMILILSFVAVVEAQTIRNASNAQVGKIESDGTVRENNIRIESFPSNIIAGMFGFAKGAFFEIDKTQTAVPNVTF